MTAGWEIEKATRERFNAIAAASGMSGGALIDQVALHMPLDERGRPVWLPAELMMALRLPRNTRVDPVTAGWEIEKATRERFNAVAAHSGMSGGALLDQVALHMPLDERGRPVWLPAVALKDGELPIDAA